MVGPRMFKFPYREARLLEWSAHFDLAGTQSYCYLISLKLENHQPYGQFKVLTISVYICESNNETPSEQVVWAGLDVSIQFP